MKHFSLRTKKGFTLIELIIVIAIIGILTALIMPNFMAGRIRARDAAKKSDMRSLKQALQMYYNDNQTYPGNTTYSTHYNSIPDFTVGNDYIKELPLDSYVFYSNNEDDTYVLRMTLENASDEDLTKSQTRCASSCHAGSPTCCTPQAGEAYYCVCPD